MVAIWLILLLACIFALVWTLIVCIERTSTASVYHVPFKRLLDPRWAITRVGLTYVFCGRSWNDPRGVPMRAVFWLGNEKEDVQEAARRIVRWANEHKLDDIPKIDKLVERSNLHGHGNYASVDDVMRLLEEWRLSKSKSNSRVEEVE